MKYIILILLAALAIPFAARSQAVILKTDTVSISCSSTDTLLMPVRVRNFKGVASVQFTLQWVAPQLKFIYVTPGPGNVFLPGAQIGFDTSSVLLNQGKLAFTWTRVGGTSFPDDTPIFFVAFKRVGGPYSPVAFSSIPVVVELTDKNGDELLHTLMNGGVLPVDTVPPTITCPPNSTLQSNGPVAVNGISPTSVADNCTVQQVGWSVTGATTGNFPTDPDASGAIFNLGSSTVVYKVTDVGNATATCSFSIMVEPSNTSDTLAILAGSGNASCGTGFAMPITALNFDSLGSLQFSINWNPLVLKFDSVSITGSALNSSVSNTNFGTSQTANGLLAFSWTSPTSLNGGTTISNGGLLFKVYLSPVAGSSGMAQVQFGDVPAFREAYEASLPPEEVPVVYIPGQINISDIVPPSLTCPQNIGVQALPGEITANITTAAPAVPPSDNCSGNVALTYAQTGATNNTGTGNANGDYNAGTTTVTYTATDVAGNTATCSFQVFVDAGKPLLLVLDSIEIPCGSSAPKNIAVNVTVGNFKDLLGLQFSIKWDTNALNLVNITNVDPGSMLTATSNAFIYADTALGIFRFLGGPPSGTWPSLPDGSTIFTLNFKVNGAGSISPLEFLGPFDAVNSIFQSVLVSTQNGGFKSTADVNPPEFVFCPSDTLVVPTGPGCNATLNFQAIVKDDCSGVKSLVSNQNDNIYEPGTTDVTFTATDSAGNSSKCMFQVLVEPSTILKLKNCPPQLVTGYATAGSCEGPAFWQEPQITNVCDFSAVKITANHQSGDIFTVNTTVQVTYMAEDTLTGSFDLCFWTVVVLDTLAPKLTCPKDTMLAPNSFSCSAKADFAPIATDNCTTSVTLTSTPLKLSDNFPTGKTLMTVVATDATGNFSQCQFSVTVVDNEAPFFTCPQDTVVSTGLDSCARRVFWVTPQAFDNCDTTILFPTTTTPSGSIFQLGKTTVTYQSTDASGNKAVCTFLITVKDDESPQLACPVSLLINLPAAQCDTALTWEPVQATDNCTLMSLDSTGTWGVFPAGTTQIMYTATDMEGNTSTCSFSITAKDSVRPLFENCPKDTMVNTTDPCGLVLNWQAPTAKDNCTPPNELIFMSSKNPADTLPIGETGILITVADASGNIDTCKFNISIVSTIVPGLDSIPASQMLIGCEAIASWKPPVVKGFCTPPDPVITSDYAPGDTFKLGTTVVTYKVTDAKGITYTATFSITVSETVPPVLSGCPKDSIVVTTAGTILSGAGPFLTNVTAGVDCSGALLTFVTPVATDNCGLAVVEQTTGQAPGTLFVPGSSVLTFKATDASGNSTLCSVKVTVQGIPAPTISISKPVGCPGESATITTTNIPGATYVWKKDATTLPDNDFEISVTEAGTYSVELTIGSCKAQPVTVAYEVAQKPDAVDDFTLTIDPGKTDTFNVLINDTYSATDFKVKLLSTIAGLDTVAGKPGFFRYTASAQGGKPSFLYEICSMTCPNLCDMATVTITVRETDCTFVPNIITPNNDSENDVLVIPCLQGNLNFRSNTLVVYNQWGDKVFEASPYKNDWNGTLNNEAGKDLPDGTYFYIFKPGPNEAVLRGFVEIYR